ncbi:MULTISPECIES: elongation factor G [unclassified Lysobacter]|uniref:elongation factor G n=1 Tax=unclassified Lysobacter TaxID=2635362 RepID=UPI0006F77570|nr:MULTISPECIES: elongation factor G [unclassified Lysobacter]KQZ60143.1 elongation factor G [Lysobacter sp. Root559]KRA76986.1 elongation factor G [Lysobacter sp. Root667]KRC38584.1 elongation factor G [Lysobacter sp. Root76]KRD71214.1 elongation factor G [Lysobacter sp. Root96]
MSYSTQSIRNVALAGHPGAGKTTLFEALLQAGGALQTAGSIERGSTVSDFDPIEKQRGHSLDAAIASIDRAAGSDKHVHVNLIDTPGYPDFRGPTLSALAAVETVAIVVDADTGVEYGTRRMMEHAKARNLCRVLVVNKIDHEGADAARVLDDLRETFGPECLPLNLPADGGQRVADCFGASAAGSSETSDLGAVADWHQKIIDQVVEINETVMEHYLDLGESGLSGAELHDAFEQCLREGHLVPVLFCSARSGVGVKELLDAAEALFPNPAEANPPPFVKGVGEDAQPIVAAPDPAAHVIADVFKIINDPFVGKLGVFRVYQGTLKRDTQLFVDDGKKPFKVGHLFKLKGKDHIEIDQAIPGDIAAVAKVEDLHFDAVLHDSHDEDQIHLAPLNFPKPMFGLAVEAASKGQEQKLATSLYKLSEEDPCFHVEHETETNETVVRGLSDLHLRINIDRLRDKYGVEVTSRPPRIAYRETVSGKAEGHHRHKKQTGGAGQFGEVFLRVEPLPRGSGFEFVDEVKGGTIPGQFLPAVEKGVRQVLHHGALAGYPMQDVRVIVYDGKHHPVDSKEVAFVAAGKKAFLDAISKARPQVLEPIVDLEVNAPEQHMGDISGGLASKRARINGTDAARGHEIVVKAQVPLSELEGYAAELKSVTAGRGRYSLDFSHYEPVPANVQQKLVEAFKPRAEED